MIFIDQYGMDMALKVHVQDQVGGGGGLPVVDSSLDISGHQCWTYLSINVFKWVFDLNLFNVIQFSMLLERCKRPNPTVHFPSHFVKEIGIIIWNFPTTEACIWTKSWHAVILQKSQHYKWRLVHYIGSEVIQDPRL